MSQASSITRTRFPERFGLRGPCGLTAATELVAGRKYTSPSEYARQPLLRALTQDGVGLDRAPTHRASRPREAV